MIRPSCVRPLTTFSSESVGQCSHIREFAVKPPDQLVANFSQELPVLGG
jgi:hypothetical protein